MSDRKISQLPYDGDDPGENKLWDMLAEISAEEPSGKLRQGFYDQLEQASRPTWSARLRDLLGFSGNAGWITATTCVLLGLGSGLLLSGPAGGDGQRLTTLEQNVAMLNRTLILDRLENDTAGKRLLGVMDAAFFAGSDIEVANALLLRATADRVPAVRSAAIDALGSQITTPAIGGQLMELLQQADSPMVQLALVDLVLRNGSSEQITQILTLAEDGVLHPDVAQHVFTSLQREVA